jgi:hypothetical protein
VCWIVGLILFVSVGILLLLFVVVRIAFGNMGFFFVVFRPVLLILVMACVGSYGL